MATIVTAAKSRHTLVLSRYDSDVLTKRTAELPLPYDPPTLSAGVPASLWSGRAHAPPPLRMHERGVGGLICAEPPRMYSAIIPTPPGVHHNVQGYWAGMRALNSWKSGAASSSKALASKCSYAECDVKAAAAQVLCAVPQYCVLASLCRHQTPFRPCCCAICARPATHRRSH